jgi:hypothetical protein
MMPLFNKPLAILQGESLQGNTCFTQRGKSITIRNAFDLFTSVYEKKLRENKWCCSVFASSKIQNNEALAAKPIGSTSMVVSGPRMDSQETWEKLLRIWCQEKQDPVLSPMAFL